LSVTITVGDRSAVFFLLLSVSAVILSANRTRHHRRSRFQFSRHTRAIPAKCRLSQLIDCRRPARTHMPLTGLSYWLLLQLSVMAVDILLSHLNTPELPIKRVQCQLGPFLYVVLSTDDRIVKQIPGTQTRRPLIIVNCCGIVYISYRITFMVEVS
jgi:hypothetical protein